MTRLIFLFLISYFTQLFIHAQDSDNFRFQAEINTDNDAFIIWENFDRYYTYGAGFRLNFQSEKLLGLQNLFKSKSDVFFGASFRTEGYTPTRDNYSEEELTQEEFNFERPFAGLLFATFDVTYLFEQSFLKTEIYLGIMGPSAYSREIQDWIHNNITDDEPIDGWQFQIPDQPIFNINTTVAKELYSNHSWFDLYAQGELRLGNLYIDMTPVLGFRFGKFASVTKSNVFGNGLLASKSIKEIFIRSTFSATATAFNGTAQGRLFNNDYQYVVEDLSHFHTTMTHGLFYTGKRFGASFDHVFTFGKVNKRVRHIYGRFSFTYRF